MKITPSLAGQMSGSLGGLTASHNRGGAYLRRRVVPVNPNTARQAEVRSNFASLVNAWTNELDDAERNAWVIYAQNTPTTDVVGSTLVLTGQQMYLRCNTPRLQAGLARIDAAPVVYNTGETVSGLTAVEYSVGPNALALDGTFGAPLSDAATLLLFFGSPINPSRNFYKGPYQLAATLSVIAAATTFTFTTAFTALLSDYTPSDGGYQSLRLALSFADGRYSAPFSQLVTWSELAP